MPIFNTISKIFSNSLDGTSTALEPEDKLGYFIRSNIEANRRLWDLEDSARIIELGSEHIATAKREINKGNQIRNDLIREIDAEIGKQLGVMPLNSQERFYSESPGMIIDRLSILYIKLSAIKDLLAVFEEDLKKEYGEKEKAVLGQIKRLGSYLDSYFNKLKNKEA